MIFNMLKFHSHFIAKKRLRGAFYCRKKISVVPGSFYINFIGHAIKGTAECHHILLL